MFKFLSVGPGKQRSDIGDEAYFWQAERTGFAGIRFRKANVYIDVSTFAGDGGRYSEKSCSGNTEEVKIKSLKRLN